MFSDLKFIILWWLTVFGFGLVTLPIVILFFKNFWDRGYIFSKTLGLLLTTYIIFVLGVFKLAPFHQYTIMAVIAVFLAAEYFFLHQKKFLPVVRQVIKEKLPVFILEECLFLFILITWSLVRGFAPDIEGLEKFMDWGFVNSALRSNFMPPQDMWFAGLPINYYYFGHLVFALLTKISSIDSTITYNLSIALVCALTFVSGFSLASNLAFITKKISLRTSLIVGLLSAIILTFGGNLHTLYKIGQINIKNNGHLILTIPEIQKAAQSYWYPDATRFIGFDPDVKDKTIHEFPLYSFVVADLHGHMNDIPTVLLFMATIFCFSLLIFPSITKKQTKNFHFNIPLVLISGWLLSVAYTTNAWDFAVYGLVFAVFFFVKSIDWYGFRSGILNTLIHGFAIILAWYVFTLPYSLNFIPMAEGLRLSDSHTPFYQLFVLYGGFWLMCIPFALLFIVKKLTRFRLLTSDYFAFALIITATILIIIPEIGYIKDIYIYEHRRANTMFKLVYEAFIMYSLVSAYCLVRLPQILNNKLGIFYKTIWAIVFSVHLIYPYFAIKSYYGLKEYKGLYGLNFFKNRYPDNFQAYQWIQANITGQPVMLEAVGDSYTDYDLISSATGLPTVQGWVVHEWLWRGGYDKPSARQSEVQKIYTSENESEIRSLLQKYNISYIFVGDKEYEKYPKINERAFNNLGLQTVFESSKTKIYKVVK